MARLAPQQLGVMRTKCRVLIDKPAPALGGEGQHHHIRSSPRQAARFDDLFERAMPEDRVWRKRIGVAVVAAIAGAVQRDAQRPGAPVLDIGQQRRLIEAPHTLDVQPIALIDRLDDDV
jgi:hypothetical protein